jgi:hypothetical protein
MRLYFAIWLLILTAGLHAQQPTPGLKAGEDDDCLEWAYEPVVDFLHPQFGEPASYPLIDRYVDFSIMLNFNFSSTQGDIELLEEIPKKQPMPSMYHGPPFKHVEKAPTHLPAEFYAPKFEKNFEVPRLPEDFHAPRFGQQAKGWVF